MGKLKDLTGQRFGKLVVVERCGSVNNRANWKCRCDCGGWRTVCGKCLRNGSAVDCGCSETVIDEQDEIWKPVVGYEHKYEVSNHGRVKSCKRYRKGKKGALTLVRERLLVQTVDHSGYMKVGLYADNHYRNYSVHRLVGEAFIPNPYGLEQINHKDENKKNNHVSNLEWCTNEYNSTYGTRLDRISKKNASNPKFKKPVVRDDGAVFESITDMAVDIGRTIGTARWYLDSGNIAPNGHRYRRMNDTEREVFKNVLQDNRRSDKAS